MAPSVVSSIQGTLESTGPDWADVTLGNITLRVSVPASTVELLGQKGNRVRLYTSLQVREDSLTLYGFLAEEARAAFEALIGVNGVGPRIGLSVLSRMTPEMLARAVAAGDVGAFGGIPWVGKKTASRIVLELRGKLYLAWAAAPAAGGDVEVIEALTALGYTVAEAREALAALKSGEAASLEDKVRLVLQHMGVR